MTEGEGGPNLGSNCVASFMNDPRGIIFLQKDLKHSPLQPKASVLPMSYNAHGKISRDAHNGSMSFSTRCVLCKKSRIKRITGIKM